MLQINKTTTIIFICFPNVFKNGLNIVTLATLSSIYISVMLVRVGTVQIYIRHVRGVCRVRYFVVSRGGVVTAPEAKEHKESHNQDERVPAGVSANLQADAAFHDRRLRRRAQGRQ